MTIKLSALLLTAVSLALAQAPQSAASFRHDYLINFSDVETKVLSLAKAIPQEKYSWRPGSGVRSVSEVYVHIANGNRLLLSVMNGMPPREAFMKTVKANEERERTVTEKSKVVADLEASFKEVHAALDRASEEDLSKAIKFFGQDATPRAVYLSIMNHASEHLGQSIAYARMNGIVPPWSR
ncbi:MAG TPA: DinB family protein [Bryobacteraceae bacterium]|nr:DinB family protein [Bryobacteraceae bacterium]